MNNEEIYALYVLQSKNVRKLKKFQKILVRDINQSLIRNDNFQLEVKTKLLALVYCALSEAQFVQILHTPSGFSYSEIQRIKSERSLAESWKLMIELALDRVNAGWMGITDLINKKAEIISLIIEYIEGPQELRNKIAHGQWEHALNSTGTKENGMTTARIQELNVVQISIWAEVHQFLGLIIRDLIQSPVKGFHNNYWSHFVELQQFVLKSRTWTLEKRRSDLQKKPRVVRI